MVGALRLVNGMVEGLNDRMVCGVLKWDGIDTCAWINLRLLGLLAKIPKYRPVVIPITAFLSCLHSHVINQSTDQSVIPSHCHKVDNDKVDVSLLVQNVTFNQV